MVYTMERRAPMAKSGVAKLFRNGRSQAVRLPREFRFEGDAVRGRRGGRGGLFETLIPGWGQGVVWLGRAARAGTKKKGRKKSAQRPRERMQSARQQKKTHVYS